MSLQIQTMGSGKYPRVIITRLAEMRMVATGFLEQALPPGCETGCGRVPGEQAGALRPDR